jgi:regulator of RNase E activity RraA
VANRHADAALDAGGRNMPEIGRDYGLPIFARLVLPGTTLGLTAAIANQVPVMVGGLIVHPGDIDGALVILPNAAEEVPCMSPEIDSREAEQARLIIEMQSPTQGLAKYGRA